MKKEFEIDILDQENVASGSECTGLIPALPEEQENKDAYSDIYKLPKK